LQALIKPGFTSDHMNTINDTDFVSSAQTFRWRKILHDLI